jgi:signal transduction histidine kinase
VYGNRNLWRMPASRCRITLRGVKHRAYMIDALLAAAALGISVAVAHQGTGGDPELRAPDFAAYALLTIYSGAVVARRRFPLGATLICAAAGFAYAAAKYPPALTPALLLPVYTAATRLEWRVSRRLLVAVVIIGAIGATVSPGATDVGVPVLIAAAWLLGHYMRTGRLYTAELERTNRELERTNRELERAQVDLARQAVVAERLRIARDLHDAVAHTMSVVAVHAGSARMIAADDPAAARAALETIETASRSALAEMRRLLGVLRTSELDSEATVREPAPGLRDLDALVADVVRSGVTAEVRVLGERPEVPPGIDLCAYRIVQEALTNVIKHAGPVRARVIVEYLPDAISLEIENDALVPTKHSLIDRPVSGGLGVVGMRERVAMHGGRITVGPRAGGGFVVHARFPLGDSA